ncbi:MAG TPA: glycosyltransferase family 1 protein [Candidatus Dojkabacteria bacterium]|nr:glycosyltransferase family 1 protein [Candidatus Dojkabacteria bacterium]
MRIIIDARITQDEIKFNGVGRYGNMLVSNMLKTHPNTEFVLMMYDGSSTLDEFLKEKFPNVRIHRIGKYFNGRGMDLIIHNMDIFFQIRMIIEILKVKKKGDVFFCPYFMRGVPSLIIPTYVTIHDFALPKLNIYSAISPIHNLLRAIYYWWQMLPVYFSKGVFCDSKYTLDDFMKYLPFYNKKQVHEILLGTDIIEKETNISKYFEDKDYKKNYFIYLGGGITKNKNSEGVVKAYAEFSKLLGMNGEKKIPYLVIAGKNFIDMNVKEVKALHQLAKDLGVYNRIIFTGKYDDINIYSLLNNSIASIHLSLLEGFGFSVVEGMRAKSPVIVHDGSCYPEVVKNGGILVNGLDSKEVANEMYEVYSDHNYAKDIAQKGYQVSLLYDWKKTADQTYSVLTSA